MVQIRPYQETDYDWLKRIYEKFYTNDFPFPYTHGNVFVDKGIVITDEGIPITHGTFAIGLEIVALTDKSKSIRIRKGALDRLLKELNKQAIDNGYNRFYCNTTDLNWQNILLEHFNFNESIGKYLVKNVE